MTGFVFVIIFGLSSLLLSCEGQIISTPDGTNLTILPGSSENITWNYNEDPPNFAARSWYFTSTDGSHSAALLAQITSAFGLQVVKSILPRIAITQPATLSLNNVSQSYDGTYQFNLKIGSQSEVTSNVRVYIAKKPTVRINCSSPTTVNEGDDVICLCRGEGGNPPANVTWSKDDDQIGGIGTENKTLILNNANETHSGIYKCKAQSYDHPDYIDEKNITLVVKPKFKPRDTTIKIKPSQTNVGEPVVITCFSEGVPDPHFIITHNDTNFTTTDNPYRIDKVQKSQGGTYTCIAINEFGSDFTTGKLNVTVEVQSTTSEAESTTFQPKTVIEATTETGTTPSGESKSGEINWFIVIMSLLGVVIIGIVLSYIVWRCCRKSRSSKHQSNPEPQTTEVDPTYQELDLNKMNKEDNYQSLTGNYAASNDVGNEDKSAYTELKKIRDVENQYQSLQ